MNARLYREWGEWRCREYAAARAGFDAMDDMSEWAISHPLINTRTQVPTNRTLPRDLQAFQVMPRAEPVPQF